MPGDGAADLAGRTALVTGASGGIGLEIARGLAAAGAELILPVRDRVRGAAAVEEIRRSVPAAHVELRDLDLASLDSVAGLVAGLDGRRIDDLVLNAGVMLLGDRRRHVTDDGLELHFQTNFLGHAALLAGLRPALRVAHGRVVAQCSLAAARARLHWEDLQGARHYGVFRAYAASKLALGAFVIEFGRRAAAEGIRADLCHPGVVPATAIAPPIRAMLPRRVVDWAAGHLGNPLPVAAAPALLALRTTVPAPVMAVPAGPAGLWGPAVVRAPYGRLTDPDLGSWAWGLAEGLLHRAL